MNKKLLKRLGLLIIILVFCRLIIIGGLNSINVHISNFMHLQNNIVELDEPLDNYLYTIAGNNKVNGDDNKNLYIKSNDHQEFNLFLNNLTFLHTVYINDRIASQNINKTADNYDSDYAYKSFEITSSNYLDNTVNITLTGNRTDKTDLFLATDSIANDSRELRTIINVIFMVLLAVTTLVGLILFLHDKKNYFLLIFSFMGIVSVVKTIVLGELFVFSRFLNIDAHNYQYVDNFTSVLNTVLPLFILCYLFDYKINRIHMSVGFGIILLLGINVIIRGGIFLNFYNPMFFLTFTVSNLLLIWGFIKDKPYSIVMMVNSVVYSSCTIYYLMVLNGRLLSGNIIFFMNPAYLGAVVYMCGFLLAILWKHLDKVRELENQKKEYERVSLLRGISHDLKLPLSVIKLNNQMMEKYELSDQETKEYAQTSLEAALELEKMTENINSYLSLRQVCAAGESTSVKESFEKLKKYYNLYNQDGKCRFTVQCDEKDCRLDVSPLHFNRMLYNLVDNALKYIKNEAYIAASYKIDKDLTIVIEDNGIGMDKEEIDKVFEPFFRIDPSRTVGGLGLGLSVVKGIVDSMGGKIEVDSNKGVGTKIIITFTRFHIQNKK